MEPLGSPFDETLDARTAFVKKVTVTATRDAETAELAPLTGTLTQDARRSLRWNGSLSIPVEADLFPTTPADLLTPFGTTVEVMVGLEMGDGTSAQVPYGTYDIAKSRATLAGGARMVNLELVDLGQLLARYRFERPYTIPSGTELSDAVALIVVNRLGLEIDLEATGVTLGRKRVFGLEPSTDPAREIMELVEGFGYRIWFNRAGDLVLDQPPVPDATQALVYQGELTVDGAWENKPPNVVVVRGEHAGTGTPIQAVAYDNDSSSPTWAGSQAGQSPYGRVTDFFTSPLITTANMATSAARSRLARKAAQGAAWNVTKGYDPTVDCDDVLEVPLDESTNLPLVVQAVTLSIEGATTVNCRSLSRLDDA
jgi:hypothetical protein